MKALLLLFVFYFAKNAYSQIITTTSLCPGGRIEHRNTGRYCCYDKQETSCYKIISPVALLDEDRGRFGFTLLRASLNIGRKIWNAANRRRRDEDRVGIIGTTLIKAGLRAAGRKLVKSIRRHQKRKRLGKDELDDLELHDEIDLNDDFNDELW